ncbi:MAG: FecR domain-containing protein [Cytophagales bacterium]|nr:FecR domain-containing protein [Cytophagales bacterium]
MDYRNFDLTDFILDEYFQDWVINPTEASDMFWNNWMENNREKKKVIEQARAIIQNLNFISIDISEFDKNSVLDHINAAIRAKELTEELKVPGEMLDLEDDEVNETIIYALETTRDKIRIWYRVAAVIFVVASLGISLAFLHNYFDVPSQPLTEVNECIEKSCGPGEKLNVKLKDGTKIKLNSNSKLIFPRTFASKQRKVTLIGEAFFEVSEDQSRPFIITSGQIATVVHGTSFNVRAFPYEPEIKVAVATGRVSVEKIHMYEDEKTQQAILLSPREMAVFEKETKKTEKLKFEFIKEMGWKDGIIHFEQANIHEVLQTLENWYGVTFIKNGKINEDRDYTGSFNNKSLEVVLTGLGLVFDFKFEIKGKIIELN